MKDLMQSFHEIDSDGTYISFIRGMDKGKSPIKGDGGIHCCPEDWHKFSMMLLQKGLGQNGQQILREDVFENLVKQHTPSLVCTYIYIYIYIYICTLAMCMGFFYSYRKWCSFMVCIVQKYGN